MSYYLSYDNIVDVCSLLVNLSQTFVYLDNRPFTSLAYQPNQINQFVLWGAATIKYYQQRLLRVGLEKQRNSETAKQLSLSSESNLYPRQMSLS